MSTVVNGITYSRIESSSTATVSSSTNANLSASTTIPSSVTIDGVTCSVISIGSNAFINCGALTSVIIPNSVTSIGTSAFQGCTNLTSVTIPNSVTSMGSSVFFVCRALTSITIPNLVTSIGLNMFRQCNSLTSITIPNSVTNIGTAAFLGCDSLTSITLPSSLTSISNSLFNGCEGLTELTIPTSVTSIGSDAFTSCYGLTTIIIPSSVTSIGDAAFSDCTYLTSIEIPSSVTSIGIRVFSDCTELTSVILLNSPESIGDQMFSNCEKLTSIIIPNSVTIIDLNAFFRCYALTSVTLSNSLTSIGQNAFSNCISLTSVTIPSSVTSIGQNAFSSCSSLTGITIPSSVTSIGQYAFSSCSSLASITIPNSVTSIGQYAFWFCYALTSVTISSLLTTIDIAVFQGCFALTSVTIPNSVTSILDAAFENCTALTSVTLSNSLTSIALNAFNSCSNLTSITIPSSVTIISQAVFANCSSLASITIPDSVTSMGSGVFMNCTSLTSVTLSSSLLIVKSAMFENCTSLTSIIIPNSVTSIEPNVFQGCTSLSSITLSNSLLSIGSDMFQSCTSLTSITLPNSVTSIEEYAFRRLANLTTLSLSASLTTIPFGLCSECPSLTSITIPNSVTSIGDGAFEECSSLASVTLSNSLTSIGSYTFSGCVSLISVIIPSSVTSIGAYAFVNWSNLPVTILIGTYTPIITSGDYYSENSQNYIDINFTQSGTATNYAYSTDGTNYTTLSPAQTTSPLTVAVSENSSVSIKGINSNRVVNGFTILGTSLASNSVTPTLIVEKTTTVLTLSEIGEKTYRNNPFNITVSSNSPASIIYESSNTGVATISGTTVTIVGAGETYITVSQLETTDYTAGSATRTLTVSKASPDLTLQDIGQKTYNSAPFDVSSTSLSSGTISYESSNTAVATISGSTVTIVGLGTTLITATQTETSNFLSDTKERSLIVTKNDTGLSLSEISAKTYGDDSFELSSFSDSPASIIYESSNTGVATILGSTVTIVGAGTAIITASQAETEFYSLGSATRTLLVNKAVAPITLSDITKTYGDSSFDLSPSSSSTGSYSYTSSDTGVASILGSTVTIVGAGTVTIEATQATSPNYLEGLKTVTLTVNKGIPTITLLDIMTTYGENAFEISALSNSTGAISYTIANPEVATISGTTVTIIGAGSTTIEATQAESPNYQLGSITRTLTVSKAIPTIKETSTMIMSEMIKTYGDPPFLISACSNSTGPIEYSSSNTAVATISDRTVTIVGTGTTTITASQSETMNYFANIVTSTLIVNKASPGLSLSEISEKTYEDESFELSSSSLSSGIISYESSNTTVATILGSTVTIVGAGSTTITASQDETDNYSTGSATRTLTVNRALTPITISNITKTYGDIPFGLSSSSNSTGSYSYTSSDPSVATISGATVTIIGAGTATITTDQAETTNYLGNSTTCTLTVDKAIPGLTLNEIGEATYDGDQIQLSSSSLSSGSISYTSSLMGVATISGSTVTIISAGTTTITATQIETPNYLGGVATGILTVNKASPTISMTEIGEKTYGDAPFQLVASSESTETSIIYTSSNTGIATISGTGLITIVGAGTATITAAQVETDNYLDSSVSDTLIVNKASAGLILAEIGEKMYGDVPFQLQVTTNSPGTIEYSSSNTSVATISGTTVTIVGAGTATITASQLTTSNYLSDLKTRVLNVVASNASNPIVITGGAGITSFFTATAATYSQLTTDIVLPPTNISTNINLSSTTKKVLRSSKRIKLSFRR